MQKLAVSEDTIRRDIKELDTRDLLRAVRGGAHSIVQKNTTIATGKKKVWKKKGLSQKRLYP
nr:DeoR family transcriptional regulator [Elizabethkingia bruuniana]